MKLKTLIIPSLIALTIAACSPKETTTVSDGPEVTELKSPKRK